jgi:fatty-acid O-methyltransferase
MDAFEQVTRDMREFAIEVKRLGYSLRDGYENRATRRGGGVRLTDGTLDRTMRKLVQGVNNRLYPYITRRVGDDVLFLNWGYEEDPPMGIPLEAADEPNRYPIQLYHCTVTQAGELAGKRVVEVGCGHGGGASYLTRALGPASYVGLDVNRAGIEFCRRRHQLPGLEFVQGDALNLPFPRESFDALINIESSHCYPDFDRFLGEVGRVLRPGGVFLHADVRCIGLQCARWEAALASVPGLRVVSWRDITAEVLRGIELNSAPWRAAMDSLVPRFLRRLAHKAAPAPGSGSTGECRTGRPRTGWAVWPEWRNCPCDHKFSRCRAMPHMGAAAECGVSHSQLSSGMETCLLRVVHATTTTKEKTTRLLSSSRVVFARRVGGCCSRS